MIFDPFIKVVFSGSLQNSCKANVWSNWSFSEQAQWALAGHRPPSWPPEGGAVLTSSRPGWGTAPEPSSSFMAFLKCPRLPQPPPRPLALLGNRFAYPGVGVEPPACDPVGPGSLRWIRGPRPSWVLAAWQSPTQAWPPGTEETCN